MFYLFFVLLDGSAEVMNKLILALFKWKSSVSEDQTGVQLSAVVSSTQ